MCRLHDGWAGIPEWQAMTWMQVGLWVGSVWFAFLIGFAAGAAWTGIVRGGDRLANEEAWARDLREEEAANPTGDVRRRHRSR